MSDRSLIRRIWRRVNPVEFALQLLRVDVFRYWVAFFRYLWRAVILRKMRTYDLQSKSIGVNTVYHNLKNLRQLRSLSVTRSHLLVRPLAAVQDLNGDSKILSIGPRSEGELLNLVSVGFRPRNIRGLDLISYSKWIDLGDMHDLPYADNTWDAVLLGWCLAYSDNRPRAAREVVRVARSGAVIAVGVEYNPESADELSKKLGYEVPDQVRTNSVQEVLDLFAPHVDHVYFSQDVPPARRDRVSEIIAVFSIKK